jgi:hypothetical protein
MIGTNQYVIERGTGYEQVANRGMETIVTFSKEEVNELLDVLDTFEEETKTILNLSNKLLKYYLPTNRQNLVLRIAGYLHKQHVSEYLCCNLVEYLIDVTGDDEPVKRLQAIRDTYVKDANTEQVSGRLKLLEAVDGDESVILIINQELGKLGYHFTSNGNGNGNARGNSGSKLKTEKEMNEKYEYVQKYSISETVLAEAIIIGQKAFFAVSDFTNHEELGITLQKEIRLDDDRKTVLKPLDLVAYINKPYRFESKEEFWGYIEKAKCQTLDSLYASVEAIFRKYVDADILNITICSADTIFTHKQDRVGTTHYLFFVGDNESGKSAYLTILEYLAYRNICSIGITYANIYQFLGSRDEGVGTISEDEADNIDKDTEKMRLYKSGYTKGKVVPKTDTTYGRTQYKFNAYCFKAFAAERLPDPQIAKGFLQRIVELKCVAGFPDYDISEAVDPGDDEELQALLDELVELRILIFCYCRLLHYKDRIPNIKLNIRNREKQLFKPVLRVFYGTKTFNILLPVISNFVTQKRQAKVDSYHSFLFQLIKKMIIQHNSAILQSKDIWEAFKEEVDWKPVPNKPQSIDTVEFGEKSQKELNQTLQDVFGAKPPKRHGKARSLAFDTYILDKMSRVYDVDVDIQVQEGDVKGGTLGTLGSHVGLTQYLFGSDPNTDNADDKKKDYKNNTISDSNTDKIEQSGV